MKNKAKILDKKIQKLPESEQKVVKEYFEKRPEKIYGVQRSLIKGFADLPIFRSDAQEKQQDLF